MSGVPPFVVDSHAHLDGHTFDQDREEAILRAREAGVGFILAVGNAEPELDSMEKALEICRTHDGMATSVGIHPHDARIAGEEWSRRIRNLASDPLVWAVGEIGLDYHYDLSPRETQRKVFREHLSLARELGLPVIVHSREADEDTLAILGELWAPPHPGGIMHCFAGDLLMARKCLDLGFHLSFSGVVTFPRAEDMREVAASIPPGRILAETDSPYLAPVPHRGKRNEPARVVEVIATLARVRGEEYAETAALTTANFKKLFGSHFVE